MVGQTALLISLAAAVTGSQALLQSHGPGLLSPTMTPVRRRGTRHHPLHSTHTRNTATPIDPSGWPDRFPAKEHCSKCGLCETSFVSKVTEACAFLNEGMARIDSMEEKIHGRKRKLSGMVWSSEDAADRVLPEEARFGVLHQPVMLVKGTVENAQWTGCVTGIALAAL